MKDNPILICFGTRPEWLKVKPLLEKFRRDQYRVLFTGQHEDLLKSIDADYRITIDKGTNRLDDVISNCIKQFPTDQFRGVLVQGDTASAFACALASFNRGIPLLYLEAGLRTYDLKNPYPEEAYRQMISRIADINFAPTKLSANNLKEEKVSGEIHVVGNTVLDNLIHFGKCSYGDTVLVTMHRRENHDRIEEWFTQINFIAKVYKQYKFILPIHPNPNVQKHRSLLTDVDVIDPTSHEDTMHILKSCRLVITDSGGLQEEGSFFNKKIIVCRKTTERPEGIDTGHLYLCEDPKDLPGLFNELQSNFHIDSECPYGDGNSSEKIISIINERL